MAQYYSSRGRQSDRRPPPLTSQQPQRTPNDQDWDFVYSAQLDSESTFYIFPNPSSTPPSPSQASEFSLSSELTGSVLDTEVDETSPRPPPVEFRGYIFPSAPVSRDRSVSRVSARRAPPFHYTRRGPVRDFPLHDPFTPRDRLDARSTPSLSGRRSGLTSSPVSMANGQSAASPLGEPTKAERTTYVDQFAEPPRQKSAFPLMTFLAHVFFVDEDTLQLLTHSPSSPSHLLHAQSHSYSWSVSHPQDTPEKSTPSSAQERTSADPTAFSASNIDPEDEKKHDPLDEFAAFLRKEMGSGIPLHSRRLLVWEDGEYYDISTMKSLASSDMPFAHAIPPPSGSITGIWSLVTTILSSGGKALRGAFHSPSVQVMGD